MDAARSTVTTAMAAAGCAAASQANPTARRSSAKLTTAVLIGSGLAFTALRVAAFVEWAVKAIEPARSAAPIRQTSGTEPPKGTTAA